MARKSPLVPRDETEGLGPAMLSLTPLRRAFVIAKVQGGLNDVAAARAAGFTEESATSCAWAIARDDRVQAAILEEGRKLMRAHGPKSILTLVEIRDNKDLEPKDRMKAAIELLNRSGFHAVSEHHDHQHHHLSESETDRRILALAAELGLPPDEAKKMLVAPAEFQKNAAGVYELPQSEPPPEPSPANLADRARRARRKGMSPEEWEADKAQRRAAYEDRLRVERAEHEASRAAAEELEASDADGIAVDEWSTL